MLMSTLGRPSAGPTNSTRATTASSHSCRWAPRCSKELLLRGYGPCTAAAATAAAAPGQLLPAAVVLLLMLACPAVLRYLEQLLAWSRD